MFGEKNQMFSIYLHYIVEEWRMKNEERRTLNPLLFHISPKYRWRSGTEAHNKERKEESNDFLWFLAKVQWVYR